MFSLFQLSLMCTKRFRRARVTYSSLYLLFFVAGYVLNLGRVTVCLSVLHYAAEALFHLSRLFYFADKPVVSGYG